jgi:TolB-like protein
VRNLIEPVASQSVREQLDRLKRSAVFERSGKLMRFLRYVTEAVLAGEGAQLTESSVGNAVYSPEYDTRIDSAVRVEARRLRRKLGEYYAGAGRGDPVVISLPVGSYTPIIYAGTGASARLQEHEETHLQPQSVSLKRPGASIALLPLRAMSNVADERAFAEGLTDELFYCLVRTEGIRMVARGTTAQTLRQESGAGVLAAELGVDAIIQGTVRSDGTILRVTFEVTDAKDFIVFSDRIDLPDGERLQLQELVAATMLSRVSLDSALTTATQHLPSPGR